MSVAPSAAVQTFLKQVSKSHAARNIFTPPWIVLMNSCIGKSGTFFYFFLTDSEISETAVSQMCTPVLKMTFY